MSHFWRIAEERIREAQQAGVFDDLPGKGKPLELEDLSWVPEELRIGYHILKNAHVLPPEAELRKDIHTLEDLLKHNQYSIAGRSPENALLNDSTWYQLVAHLREHDTRLGFDPVTAIEKHEDALERAQDNEFADQIADIADTYLFPAYKKVGFDDYL